MIKFCVVRGTRTTTSNFFIFPFVIERCYFIFEPDPGTEGSGQLWISLVKFKFIFACLRPGRQCLTHYCSRVDRHIPRTTHDLVISRSCFAEDGKEVQIELWRTRTTIVLLTFFVWWRSRYHRRRGLRLPNVSLLWRHTQRYKQSVCWNIIILRVTRIHYIQRNQSPSHKHRRVCHSKVSHNRNRHKMRFCIAAEFFAAFFATMYISSEGKT